MAYLMQQNTDRYQHEEGKPNGELAVLRGKLIIPESAPIPAQLVEREPGAQYGYPGEAGKCVGNDAQSDLFR